MIARLRRGLALAFAVQLAVLVMGPVQAQTSSVTGSTDPAATVTETKPSPPSVTGSSEPGAATEKAADPTPVSAVQKAPASPVAEPLPSPPVLDLASPPKDQIAQGRAAPTRTAQPAASVSVPPVEAKTAEAVRLALVLSLMAILPALVICATSFTRIIVVLSMIRHGLGMPETPPNQVLISLAIFLTMFSMAPTFEAINQRALQPFLAGQLSVHQAAEEGSAPLRTFMLRQVHDQDIKAVYDIAHRPLPARAADVGFLQLVPAFMLNELRVAFRIGFVILLPFLLIDIVVSSILLALGMLMVPPSTLSLPIKVLMFVLIDGWSIILQGVLGSFQ